MFSEKRHSDIARKTVCFRVCQSALGLIFAAIASSAVYAGIDYQQKADELMPVDCLLPGAVRKLGGQMTYVTPRRPVKTTGVDCEIRGGEYVFYDRASYESALAIWQPLADAGDPRSQNYVGEIYEKGLGVDPDYERAAQWYRKAAQQDYRPAQVNLGQLYERGLGVERSMEKALAWYRKSADIQGKILKFVSFDYSDEQIAEMRRTLAESAGKADKLNRKIQVLARKLDEANRDKQIAQQQLDSQQQAIEKERGELVAQRQLLADKQAQTEAIRNELKMQLAAQQSEQQAELEQAKQEQLARLEAENKDRKNALFTIKFPKIEIKFDKYKLERLQKQLAEQEQEVNALAANLDEKERQLVKQEVVLKKKDLELAELASNYEDIQHQLNSSQKVLAATPKKTGSSGSDRDPAAPAPVITMIEPQLLATRGDVVIKTRSGVDQRTVIGQVTSSNPLIELLINDQPVTVDDKGIFQHRVPLTRSVTPVTVVAVDNEGLRGQLEFSLKIEEEGEGRNLLAGNGSAVQTSVLHDIPDIDYGNYHALVIGNSDYKSLPDLNTTIADAEAIANTLEQKYGFSVTLLENATRYDILSALNTLRGKLTEDDNLLIYYAGHGELDKVNTRGHWLPVDAEAESTANWISNVAITDLLNAMSARKVMVIADSCYSGAMTRSTLARLDAGRSEKAWVSWLKLNAEQRSRLALSSGGLAPVLDGGGGKHSIFAKAFLDVLRENTTVLEGQQIHGRVAQAVSYAAAAAQFDQSPQYAPIRFAGHEAGDFLFVPRHP